MLALWRWGLLVAALLFGVALSSGCRRADTERDGGASQQSDEAREPPWFADVTAAVGLDFVHDPGPIDGSYFMPQSVGSGAALFDMDNSGRLAIYLVNNGGPKGARNRLFRQKRDGKFEDVSSGSGLDVAGYGMGVAIGDVNNDGLPDVYLTSFGGDRLFLNQGKGRFKEVTKQAGIDNPLWGTSVSFIDYDRDGWLDLVVVNYLNIDPSQPCRNMAGKRDFCSPRTFSGLVTRLYRNRGCDPEGKWLGFEDRTVAAGLAARPGPGLGVFCADLNGDGWPDIFVANDGKANHLWINQKDGTFKEEAVRRNIAYNDMGQAQGNMGIAFGDVDGDGLTDLFVTHLPSEHHALWKQGPPGFFQERTSTAGLTRSRWRGTGFGTVLGDFDHDGALDLAIVNGAVNTVNAVNRDDSPTRSFWEPYRERNQLFGNDGKGNFRDLSLSNPAFCGWSGVSRGLAVGDVNGDGALDLLVTQIAGPARLFRNIAPRRGHWLMVRALEKHGRDAIGAQVFIETATRRWSRFVQPGSSYLCSNDPRVHFGLGELTRIPRIRVVWPTGSEESFAVGAVDRLVVVRQGQGKPVRQAKEGGGEK
jgi:hypothetical protein